MQETEEASVELIKTRKQAAIMLDFVHETLDQGSFAVAPGVIVSRLFPVLARRNDRDRTVIDDKSDQIVVVIAAITQDILADFLSQQGLGLGTLMAFAARQDKTQGFAQPISFDMDFGAKATLTPTERLSGLSTLFLRLQQHRGEHG